MQLRSDIMIRLLQIKLKIPHTDKQLKDKVCKLLHVSEESFISYKITRRSLDARKKPELFYVYTVDAELKQEAALQKKIKNKNILFLKKEIPYHEKPTGKKSLRFRPVVIGTGPAGLFCGYQLAKLGYRPILLERGANVRERMQDVEQFFKDGILKKDSNVQFGEGGAGTFSDGKLNTLVHDNSKRNTEVLRIFHAFGAPEQILYDSRPHIGTDILCDIVERMRNEIKKLGGEVRFHSLVKDFEFDTEADGRKVLSALHIQDTKTGGLSLLKTELAVLAIGHSARDTFATLKRHNIKMQAKSFAVGVRVEHAQKFINESQYGKDYHLSLPSAPYKLAAKAEDGRGVYTFCMCPGGYVVNASSEEGRLAVNGMSYSKRDGQNANSAVIVTVTPDDFGSDAVLAGMEFQRMLEEKAFREGGGKIQVQLFEDYRKNQASFGEKNVSPQIKGAYSWANVRRIFPDNIAYDIEQGILLFDKKIKGFAQGGTILSGVESRTSSPVRILRDDFLESSVRGLFPCGEGAGYAGGITSAAMDGLKVTESIIKVWCPFDKDAKP